MFCNSRNSDGTRTYETKWNSRKSDQVLDHALRLDLLWPEKTEALECKDGTCIVFRGEPNEKAIKELKRDVWDNDIMFYHGKDIGMGYSRKRKLGYICTKSKDEKEIMVLAS